VALKLSSDQRSKTSSTTMVFATRPPAALATRLLRRGLTFSRARLGGHMTVSSVLSTNGGVVPTVDHSMSVERAAQLMTECHIDAVPVTKDDRVRHYEVAPCWTSR
jgi:CBS domain-containing protein